jgi:hypothetical protein
MRRRPGTNSLLCIASEVVFAGHSVQNLRLVAIVQIGLYVSQMRYLFDLNRGYCKWVY